MDIKNVRKWYREFNEGRINVHDEQRSGRLSLPESTVARIDEMVRANRRITLEEIEDGLNEDCSHFSVHKIVSETLGYRKVSASLTTIQTSSVTVSTPEISAKEFGFASFLVDLPYCKLPNFLPLDSSVRHLVERHGPLRCDMGYPSYSGQQGHILWVIPPHKTEDNITCCYRSIRRPLEGSDYQYELEDGCHFFPNRVYIQDEFVKLECRRKDEKEPFYTNYHSFIHEKKEVENRTLPSDSKKYCILILGVDSVSRLNFHRQFPRTMELLNEELEGVEMLGYNKVGDNTFPNLIPITTGLSESELEKLCFPNSDTPLDDCPLIWKRYSEAGYRTFYAEDTPMMATFNYLKRGFNKIPTDYYFRPFILAYEQALGKNHSGNAYLCVGHKSETEATLDWLSDFMVEFHDRPYFALTWINSLTHDYLNHGSMGDEFYERFLRKTRPYLNNTIIVLLSDHGMRWGSIRETTIGKLEERLPMFWVILPERFKKEYPELAANLRINSQRLITPFDLHATLKHILTLGDHSVTESPPGFSLLKPVPVNRTCEEAGIADHWCACFLGYNVSAASQKVRDVANFVVAEVNRMLAGLMDLCAPLSLESIHSAELKYITHANHSTSKVYTVILAVAPSGAVFEASVHHPAGGVVHHEFLPQGRTVNKEYYLQVMRNLREAIRQKRPDLWKNKNWLLHHDNTPAHTSLLVRDFLAKNNTLMMPQPPYSPDLAPCDFFLFPKLKRLMKGRRYATLDEIKTASKEELKKIFKNDFLKCFEDWKNRWHKCIISHGDYFEGDKI
ncbi:hypothetical protein LAZ67_11002565, partial [Cordylochernes scorpioides]